MVPYDEARIYKFIDEATKLYAQAHQTPNQYALIWVARFEHDATAEGLGYEASSVKHLNELRVALGLQPLPVPIPNPMPPNIQTADRQQVRARVVWWLDYAHQHNPAFDDPIDLWVGYVMDDAHEGHQVGWTADYYWPNKILMAAGLPLK